MKRVLIVLINVSIFLALVACQPQTTPSSVPTQPETTVGQTEAPTPEATAVPTEAPTAEITLPPRATVQEGKSVVDFEKGLDSVTFFDLSAWGYQKPEIEIATGDEVQSGNALKFNIDGVNAYGVISCQIPSAAGDFSGFADLTDYDYLRFWVHNNGDSDVSIACILVAQSKNGCLDPEEAILLDCYGRPEDLYTTDAAGVDAGNGTGYTSVCIPSEYSGWVYYPLKKQVSWWEKTTLTEEEMKDVYNINMDIRFDSGAADTDYLIIDDICLANPEK